MEEDMRLSVNDVEKKKPIELKELVAEEHVIVVSDAPVPQDPNAPTLQDPNALAPQAPNGTSAESTVALEDSIVEIEDPSEPPGKSSAPSKKREPLIEKLETFAGKLEAARISQARTPARPSTQSPWDRQFDVNQSGFSPTTVASVQAIFISALVVIMFIVLLQCCQALGINGDTIVQQFRPDTYIPPEFFGFKLKNIGNLDQVLVLLPFAFVGCCLLTGLVVYIAKESRSRDIDWTDTHLMLEQSGPLTLAVRWSAIELVQQFPIWDIFNGKQPAFLIRTREGNQFKLKLSDISKKHNIGTFFSLIKTSAPQAELHVDPGFSSDNSYTELWLKYFSVPAERQKTGLLESMMSLDSGRYEILGTIGGGGQGTAYLANVCVAGTQVSETDKNHIIEIDPANLQLHDQVVLKEYVLPVHRGHLTAERTAEKLRAEAEILQKLNHPQIVKLKDAFVEDFRGYLVLEFISGESLKTLVERLGPQSEELVIDWALRTCDVLEYMHAQSPPVVHRDITPDNLMLQDDGTVKIVDFNVAYQVDSSATSTVVGKHAYIPAEQFRGKAVPQSDIYSLGGSLFFLLTGKDPAPITQSHPAHSNSAVSDEMDAIVARATSTKLCDRYADIAEMRSDLQKLAQRA
jgi:tRNA A-37 threonylcarbamoyl transferase component Bud32